MDSSPSSSRAWHRRFLLGLTIGFLASLGAMAAMSLGYFFDLQAKALSAYFLLRGTTVRLLRQTIAVTANCRTG